MPAVRDPLPWYPVSDPSDTQLTRDTYERLQAELEDLTTRGRVEIAALIEAARALGDLKENGDYHAAKDSQGKMESRIRQLERMLKNATVVDGGAPATARSPTAPSSPSATRATTRTTPPTTSSAPSRSARAT